MSTIVAKHDWMLRFDPGGCGSYGYAIAVPDETTKSWMEF